MRKKNWDQHRHKNYKYDFAVGPIHAVVVVVVVAAAAVIVVVVVVALLLLLLLNCRVCC